jgi:palmitoyltransferase ZDHHC9/14/18
MCQEISRKYQRITSLPPPGTNVRGWQTYLGNSVMFANGTCISGRNPGTFIFANALILLPCILWLSLGASWFAQNVSIAVPLVFVYLMVGSLVQLYKTWLMDPGILPRNLDAPPIILLSKSSHSTNNASASNYPFSQTPVEPADSEVEYRFGYMPESIPVIYSSHQLKARYCDTCHSYRPLRSSHCSSCDNCVLMFDHHCPWTSNCIGVRNYKHFYFFVSITAVLSLMLFSCGVAQLVLVCRAQRIDVIRALGIVPIAPFCILYGLIIGWSVIGLTLYHSLLVCRGQTTHESVSSGVGLMSVDSKR